MKDRVVACMVGGDWLNPNPCYVVDGYQFDDESSELLGDGQFAPFMIFDTEAQDYLPGKYATRAEAEAVLFKILLDFVSKGVSCSHELIRLAKTRE